MEHEFTPLMLSILAEEIGDVADEIYQRSELLRYLNIKTRSASRGSKSRSSFGSLYSIYVLVEDYINRGFLDGDDYNEYEGARFSDLFERQRSLPFGSKLQNHSLNHRTNAEFRKYFPACEHQPIIRDVRTKRYWINEKLLVFCIERGKQKINLAPTIVKIIDAYTKAKENAFSNFVDNFEEMVSLHDRAPDEVRNFVINQLDPKVDARIFEIISYAILKGFYGSQSIFWGWTMDDIREEGLVLYKTGRTNANDGGIDFVMKPLGRFFQVTESVDVRKYFLDIDKIQRFPLTFVIKSSESPEVLRKKIREKAEQVYSIRSVVSTYMDCVEEIINTEILLKRFDKATGEGKLDSIVEEIILQSKVEFNWEEN